MLGSLCDASFREMLFYCFIVAELDRYLILLWSLIIDLLSGVSKRNCSRESPVFFNLG